MINFEALFVENEFKNQVQNSFSKLLAHDTAFNTLNTNRYIVFPGFCDVHVHFREPGFFYKESINSGCKAAARGGFTDVCTMPNLNPVPDNLHSLRLQLSIINIDSCINVHPYGSITKGQKGEELSNMEEMSPKVVAFSDDGRGVQNDDLMREAMLKAKSLGKIVVAHCEVNSLLNGGYIHDGKYCAEHNHLGICSESEYLQIKRDLQLVKETRCKYHVCHISCKESVDLIREAKREGLDVTCETAPHYLTLDENDLQEDGRFKMNPPLRSTEDRLALIRGICDGTIDMIATDHAPHSAEEKSKGLQGSAFGVVGLETAFPVMYSKFVKNGVISLEKLVELMAINPRKRFNIPYDNSLTIWKLNESFVVNPDDFLTKGRSTPFEGAELFGKCVLTMCNGLVSYSNM